MIRFKDGPAAGQTLVLNRAPFLLRVVQQGKEFDALDLLEDEPTSEERIHAYVLIEGPLCAHLKLAKPARSGFYLLATYAAVPAQPRDKDMRTAAVWRAWCEANAAGLGWKPPEVAP